MIVSQIDPDLSGTLPDKITPFNEEASPKNQIKSHMMQKRAGISNNNFILSGFTQKNLRETSHKLPESRGSKISDVSSNQPVTNLNSKSVSPSMIASNGFKFFKGSANTSLVASNSKLPITPSRHRVAKEIRSLYSSVLYSNDAGSRQNAKLIEQSKVIDDAIKGRNVYSRGWKNQRKKKSEATQGENLEDENKILDNLGKSTYAGFQEQVRIYNKYYEDYIVDPEGKYSSKKDLKIKSIIQPRSPDTALQSPHLSSKRTHRIYGQDSQFFDRENRERKAPSSFSMRKPQEQTGGITLRLENLGSQKNMGLAEILNQRANLSKEKERVLKSEGNSQRNKVFRLIRTEDFDELEGLFMKNPALVNSYDDVRKFAELCANAYLKVLETPLHWAAKRGSIQLLDILCKFDVDFNGKDMVMTFLLDLHFINFMFINPQVGRTPMELAHRYGHKDFINVI